MDPGRSGPGGGGGGSCGASRGHHCRDHMGDGKRQFLVVVSGDFRHSLRIRQEVGGHLANMISLCKSVKLEAPSGLVHNVEVSGDLGDIGVVFRSGWNEFVNAHHIEEGYSILFVYHEKSIFKVHIFDPSGQEKSSSCSEPPSGIFGAVPPCAPCDHHVLNEQMVPDPGHVRTSNDRVYTTLPGCCLTKAQHKKVLLIYDIKKPEIPLHVAAVNKRNVNLKDSGVYIPLLLVPNHFKNKKTKDTIQLEAPDDHIYSVGASKHNDDHVVLDSGWDTFVASQRIQEKDILIFRSMENSQLEVLILDPSGHAKTSPCFVMGNSSSAQEMSGDSGDSVHIVDPPPPTVFDLSSSDDDDIVGEGMRESHSCAKTQKIASTSSPCTKSGYKARKTYDRAHVKLQVGSEPLSNNLGGSYQRPYLLSKFTTLSLQVEKKVEEKVQELQSDHPIFVKVMSRDNLDGIGCSICEMVFSVDYAKACLPEGRQSQALFLQLEGEERLWETMFNVRSSKVTRIHRGWKEFSRENALELGDICLFKLEDTNTSSLKMTVYLIRRSQIEV